MTEESTGNSIKWQVAVALCLLALIGGIWLGRVAFFANEEDSPHITQIEVLDTDYEVGGQVQYLEEEEIYILSIWTLPPAPDGSVYQVWMQNGDLVVPAGAMNPNSTNFAYAAYDGRYETLFVTVEAGPFGVEEPTTDPILEADLTTFEIEESD